MTKNPLNIYVASSWRNTLQSFVVASLRVAGHTVYDFRNPAPGNHGFAWSQVDPSWQEWDAQRFIAGLAHPISERGFAFDWNAMQNADACVLVLPSGRSAHIEAGYFTGSGKFLAILLAGQNEPELMYKMANAICVSVDQVILALDSWNPLRTLRPSEPSV